MKQISLQEIACFSRDMCTFRSSIKLKAGSMGRIMGNYLDRVKWPWCEEGYLWGGRCSTNSTLEVAQHCHVQRLALHTQTCDIDTNCSGHDQGSHR